MSTESKLITFCVPSYNSAEYLHYALDSLKGIADIEVLVIDDGSKDDTLKIAKNYEDIDPSVFHAIHQENKGHGGAINTALSLATGRYFKVLDSDDWADREALNKLLNFLKAENEPDLILMDYVYQQGRDNPTTRIHFDLYFPVNEVVPLTRMKHHMKLTDNVTLHSAIYKTQVLRDSHLTLPEHCSYEDNYFVYVPMAIIQTVAYLPEPLYQYLIGRDGQSMAYETCIRKYKDFVKCGELIFKAHDIMKFRKSDPKRFLLMKHHLMLGMMFAVLYPQLKKDEKSIKVMNDFMDTCEETYPEQFKFCRKDVRVSTFYNRGKPAYKTSRFWYKMAHLFVKFN